MQAKVRGVEEGAPFCLYLWLHFARAADSLGRPPEFSELGLARSFVLLKPYCTVAS